MTYSKPVNTQDALQNQNLSSNRKLDVLRMIFKYTEGYGRGWTSLVGESEKSNFANEFAVESPPFIKFDRASAGVLILFQKHHCTAVHIVNTTHNDDLPRIFHLSKDGAVFTNLFDSQANIVFTDLLDKCRVL